MTLRNILTLALVCMASVQAVSQSQDTTRRRTTFSYGIQFRGFKGVGHYEDAGDFIHDNEVRGGVVAGLLSLRKGNFDCGITIGVMSTGEDLWAVYGAQLGWSFLPRERLHFGLGIGGLSGRSNFWPFTYVSGGMYGTASIGPNISVPKVRLRIRPEMFIARAFTEGYYTRFVPGGLLFDEKQGIGLTMLGVMLTMERGM